MDTEIALHSAASKEASPPESSCAAAAVDVAGTWTTPGKVSSSQLRHCAHAWGWVPMRLMSSGRVPGRTASWKTTETTISATITRGSPWERESRVALTPPSMEFSMGTTARSASPRRTAVSAWGALVMGMSSAPAGAIWWTACSVKVPKGPRNAMAMFSPMGARPGMKVVMGFRVASGRSGRAGASDPWEPGPEGAAWPKAPDLPATRRRTGPLESAVAVLREGAVAAIQPDGDRRADYLKASGPPPGSTSPQAVIR